MMTQPLISVVIPNYNYGRYLGGAIESVLAQSYPTTEVVVVDDGSTDQSREVLRRYEGRIRWVRQERLGVSAARNRGAQESRGELIAFLDADDAWSPQKLERQVSRLLADPDLGLVHCGEVVTDASGAVLAVRVEGGEGWVAHELLRYQRVVVVAPGSTALVPRRVFEAIGGFDPRLSTFADWDFSYRIASRYRIGFVPEAMVQVRSHGGSMQRNVCVMEHDMLLAYDKAFREAPPELRRLQRRCLGHLHMLLAGSFLATGRPLRGLRHVGQALWLNPRTASRVLGYPARWWRRRGGMTTQTFRKRVADRLVRQLGLPQLQPMYQALLRVSLLGMNVGGGTQSLRYSGELHAMRHIKRVLALAGRDAVIFDVGAHLGQYAATILSVFEGRAQVHCFEPTPQTFAGLRMRFADDPRVHPYPFAVGSRDGTIMLHMNAARSGLASVFPDALQLNGVAVTASAPVEIVRLDTFCLARGIDHIHFLKADVEGAELDVLRGAGRLLEEERIDAIQFEFGEGHLAARTFFRDFFSLLNPTYQLYRILPHGLYPLRGYRTIYDIFVSGTNYVAIARRLERAGARV